MRTKVLIARRRAIPELALKESEGSGDDTGGRVGLSIEIEYVL